MTAPIYLPAWQRPHWQANDETALLQFFVFGRFGAGRAPSKDYGSPGLPASVSLSSYDHHALRSWEGYPLKGALGDLLKRDSPQAYRLAVDAPQVLVLHGELPDAADTGYLRDTLGVMTALLDVGGVAVIDPQILSLFDAAQWRRHYLIEGGAPVRHHLLILKDQEPDEDARYWVHTRGLRKFARPDISLRRVPAGMLDQAGLLCERLAELEALGAQFVDGQRVEVEGLAEGLTVRLSGDLNDPQFNNTCVELRWPD